jgi:hypothetical protein
MSGDENTDAGNGASDSDSTTFTTAQTEPDQRGSPEDAPEYDGQWAANSALDVDANDEPTDVETLSNGDEATNNSDE